MPCVYIRTPFPPYSLIDECNDVMTWQNICCSFFLAPALSLSASFSYVLLFPSASLSVSLCAKVNTFRSFFRCCCCSFVIWNSDLFVVFLIFRLLAFATVSIPNVLKKSTFLCPLWQWKCMRMAQRRVTTSKMEAKKVARRQEDEEKSLKQITSCTAHTIIWQMQINFQCNDLNKKEDMENRRP